MWGFFCFCFLSVVVMRTRVATTALQSTSCPKSLLISFRIASSLSFYFQPSPTIWWVILIHASTYTPYSTISYYVLYIYAPIIKKGANDQIWKIQYVVEKSCLFPQFTCCESRQHMSWMRKQSTDISASACLHPKVGLNIEKSNINDIWFQSVIAQSSVWHYCHVWLRKIWDKHHSWLFCKYLLLFYFPVFMYPPLF